MAALQKLKEANAAGVVLGLKAISNVIPRKDIDVLIRDDPDAFNLFLLALAALQEPSMTKDRMGFFEMAGIHGMPKRSWDNVEPGKLTGDKAYENDAGYCAHGQPSFPTWHRPYLAMFEQSLFVKMDEIAQTYNEPHKTKYVDASKRFRLPYYDYYRPRSYEVKFPGIIDNGMTSFPYDYSCPLIFTAPNLMIRKAPDDAPKLTPNPLYSYKFDQAGGMDWDKFTKKDKVFKVIDFPRDATVRYPRPFAKNDVVDKSTWTLNAALNSLRMDSNRLMLNMVGDPIYKDYEYFACNTVPQKLLIKNPTEAEKYIFSGFPSGSLEALHGVYHGLIGGFSAGWADGIKVGEIVGYGGGHMTRVACAAFDPIFWMHHNQIDRVFAIWQAVHKGEESEWFDNPKVAKAPLYPFRKVAGNDKDEKSWWNSNDSRTTEIFGYTYSELAGTNTEVLQRVRDMYEWSIPLRNSRSKAKAPKDMEPIDISKSQFFQDKAVQPFAHLLLSQSVSLSESPELAKRAETILEGSTDESFVAESSIETSPSEYSTEWFIDDEVERLALSGAFSIFYLLSNTSSGSVPSAADFATLPTLAAVTHIFAAPVEMCDNCGLQNLQSTIVTNTSAITSMLLDFVEIGQLQSLDAEHVIPFLQKRLKWRVLSVSGEPVDTRALAAEKKFKINVSCKVERGGRDSGNVEYSNFPEVVEGIIGNASSDAGSLEAYATV